jgi:hypothetical protein
MMGFLSPLSEYVRLVLVFIACTVLFLQFMTRDKIIRKYFKQISLYSLVIYFVNIIFYILLFLLLNQFLNIYSDNFKLMSFVFLLILSLFEVFTIAVSIKEIIVRSKKKEDLKNVCSEVRKSTKTSLIWLLIVFLVPLLCLLILGNGKLEALLILLLVSLIPVSISSFIIFPILLKRIENSLR